MHHVELKRFYPAGAIYFITSVTEGRVPLFEKNEHLELLVNVIEEERKRLGFIISAYVLLPNHCHFLINPGEKANISNIMAVIKARCAKSINILLKRTGKIWQHQFMDHIIRSSIDYQRHLEYIHHNPLKHGLVKDAKEYRWSSWHQYHDNGFEDIKVERFNIKSGKMF